MSMFYAGRHRAPSTKTPHRAGATVQTYHCDRRLRNRGKLYFRPAAGIDVLWCDGKAARIARAGLHELVAHERIVQGDLLRLLCRRRRRHGSGKRIGPQEPSLSQCT